MKKWIVKWRGQKLRKKNVNERMIGKWQGIWVEEKAKENKEAMVKMRMNMNHLNIEGMKRYRKIKDSTYTMRWADEEKKREDL